MKKNILSLTFLLLFSIFSYSQPIKVEVRKTGGKFQLYRDNQPYFIKGAGGYEYFDRLAQSGGNSIRVWGVEGAEQILDQAQKLGLTVTIGLWVQHERHGFDYNDDDAVEAQLEKFTKVVEKLKDHPALLMWGVGNEVNLNYFNMNVWYAIQDIAKMIHKTDPNHPTMTVITDVQKNDIAMIRDRCIDIDILGVNSYSGIADIPDKIRDCDWDKPYIITEWGVTGHWESERTWWEAPIEQTSTEKANVCMERYQASIIKDKDRCLGSYVFKWGNKQEMTPTWFSAILENGEETELVHTMSYLWSGNWPKNKAPQVQSALLNNQKAKDNIYLTRREKYKAVITAIDPDNDQLSFEWELIPESTETKVGGDHEDKPEAIDEIYKTGKKGELEFLAPRQKGPYRLFVYIRDGKNNVATANIPFYVKR